MEIRLANDQKMVYAGFALKVQMLIFSLLFELNWTFSLCSSRSEKWAVHSRMKYNITALLHILLLLLMWFMIKLMPFSSVTWVYRSAKPNNWIQYLQHIKHQSWNSSFHACELWSRSCCRTCVSFTVNDISGFGDSSRELFIKSSCYSTIPINMSTPGPIVSWTFTSEPKSISFSVVYRESTDTPLEQAKVRTRWLLNKICSTLDLHWDERRCVSIATVSNGCNVHVLRQVSLFLWSFFFFFFKVLF